MAASLLNKCAYTRRKNAFMPLKCRVRAKSSRRSLSRVRYRTEILRRDHVLAKRQDPLEVGSFRTFGCSVSDGGLCRLKLLSGSSRYLSKKTCSRPRCLRSGSTPLNDSMHRSVGSNTALSARKFAEWCTRTFARVNCTASQDENQKPALSTVKW